jgi:hypothetical protein
VVVPDRTDVDGDAQQATAATSLTMDASADTACMLILPDSEKFQRPPSSQILAHPAMSGGAAGTRMASAVPFRCYVVPSRGHWTPLHSQGEIT